MNSKKKTVTINFDVDLHKLGVEHAKEVYRTSFSAMLRQLVWRDLHGSETLPEKKAAAEATRRLRTHIEGKHADRKERKTRVL
jgi:hypothetical protein